ncbi:MAG: hypothetical protein AABY16_04360 [Nanoarchaeota archaeon]
MADIRLVNFVREARRRGFGDDKIKGALLSNSWHVRDINNAFHEIKSEVKSKNSITIWLDTEVLDKLQKRAKKNMFTLPEQIEDILRRSVINAKSSSSPKEKLDDMLVGLFSRKRRK